jgi:release factor glutamine methyltransferase
MTVGEWLSAASSKLNIAGISTSRLDCLILLEDCLNTNRAHILANSKEKITNEHIKWLNSRLKRRLQHEPLAYIRNRCEFYGRTFYIDQRVLVPRPETEAIIELTKSLLSRSSTDTEPVASGNWNLIDVGTGSGCIAITLALELPETHVIAIDIDDKALAVARKNAKLLTANIQCVQGDLLKNSLATVSGSSVIVTNLPYVPDNKLENEDAHFEPAGALFGGHDGMDLYRTFWKQLSHHFLKPSYIITESQPKQHTTQVDLAAAAGYMVEANDGFVQAFGPTQIV